MTKVETTDSTKHWQEFGVSETLCINSKNTKIRLVIPYKIKHSIWLRNLILVYLLKRNEIYVHKNENPMWESLLQCY